MSIDDAWRWLDENGLSSMAFFPRRGRTPAPEGALDFDIPVAANVSIGARYYPAHDTKAIVLAFHGNGEIVSDYDDIAGLWNQHGLGLFMVDYRGYGWSDGHPTLKAYHEDTHSIAKYFLNWATEHDPHSPRFVFGRSLGSHPATVVAEAHPDEFAGLIIESGFADVLQLLALFQVNAGEHSAALAQVFSNNQRIANVTLPCLILHGGTDMLLPVSHARSNHAAIQHDRKTLHIIEAAGHNDILLYQSDYFAAIQKYVQNVLSYSG